MQDAEKSVIGCILMDKNLIEKARLRLSGKMFSSETLGLVFSGMLKLHKRGTPVDIVTVLSVLGDSYKTLLTECAETVPSISAFESYVDCVLDAWRVRTMQCTAMQMLNDGMTADEMTVAMAETVKKQVEIIKAVQEGTEKNFQKALLSTYEQIMKKDTSTKTGFAEFDSMTGGLMNGCVYMVAARPGAGKTDFVLQLAVSMAKCKSVYYQSLEMTTEQLMQRVLSRVLRINSSIFRDKSLTTNQFAQIDLVYNRMASLHIVFDDEGGITLEDIAERVERCKPDVMIIDYLGLVRGNTKKAEWERTSELTGSLKALAKAQNMAIVCLVQLNREVDKSGKKPTLSDLRGGGSVEADADAVFFVWPEPMEQGTVLSGDEYRNVNLICAKNRHGPQGELLFRWQPQYHDYTAVDWREE